MKIRHTHILGKLIGISLVYYEVLEALDGSAYIVHPNMPISHITKEEFNEWQEAQFSLPTE